MCYEMTRLDLHCLPRYMYIQFFEASRSLCFAILVLPTYIYLYFAVCLFVLRLYCPVNPTGSCRARSVYLTTLLLGRLTPLNSTPELCIFFHQKVTVLLYGTKRINACTYTLSDGCRDSNCPDNHHGMFMYITERITLSGYTAAPVLKYILTFSLS